MCLPTHLTHYQREDRQSQDLKIHPPDLSGSGYTGGYSLQYWGMGSDAEGLFDAFPMLWTEQREHFANLAIVAPEASALET